MKFMTEKVFIDSNIFIYAYTGDDEQKHSVARDLLRKTGCAFGTGNRQAMYHYQGKIRLFVVGFIGVGVRFGA